MKRIFSGLVVLVMIFNLIGCGGNKGKQEVKVDETVYNGQLPITKDKITLTYAIASGNAAVTATPSNDLPIIQEYEKLTGVHIEWNVLNSYTEQITAMLNAGNDLPDLFAAPTALQDDMGDSGVLLDLTDLIKKNAPNLVKFQQDHIIEKIKRMSTSGKTYAIGGYVIPDVTGQGILINKNWLENLNLKVPATTDELYNVLRAFKDKDPNGNGQNDEIPLSTNGKGFMQNIEYAFGVHSNSSNGYNVDKNGKVTYDYITTRYKDYLTYMNKLYTDGLLDKGFPKVAQNTLLNSAQADKVGVLLQYASWAGKFSGLNPKGDVEGLTPVYIPVEPLAGPYGDKFAIRRIDVGGLSASIAKSCKHPDIAVRWLDFVIYSKQAQDLYAYGVEGLTFKMENGKKVPVKPSDPNKSWEQALIEIGGRQPAHPYVQTLEARKTMFPEWIFPYEENRLKYFIDPFTGNYTQLTDEERSVWDQHASDIDKYLDDMDTKFITGQVPLSGFDEYVSNMKQMGIDKLIEIQQKRYDRFQELKKGLEK